MEPTETSMQCLVDKIRKQLLLKPNPNLLLSPSPYDTAWLALIPDPHDPTKPLFEKCLHWIIENQTTQGFWAAADYYLSDGSDAEAVTSSLECLVATLACLVALKRWHVVGPDMINKGLKFVHRSAEKLVTKEKSSDDFPRWFTLMFPAMLELAKASGLHVTFPDKFHRTTVVELFQNRNDILSREKLDDNQQYSPLLMFLETLPSSYYDDIDDDLEEYLEKNLCGDGSLFQSPSATARAYMTTRNTKCLSYLESLTKSYPNGGVPSFYRVDGELEMLLMVNQLMRSGLAEYFVSEIEQILLQVQRNYESKRSSVKSIYNVAPELYKDSLAFWLLRINGHRVSPSIFCWFLHDSKTRNHIATNYQDFAQVLLNVYRAADLMFLEEFEVEEARSFARKYLQKIISAKNNTIDDHIMSSLRTTIGHELRIPWMARMDHLEHRRWMEETASNTLLWMGKSSHHRLSCLHNDNLLELALKDFALRQSTYLTELQQVKRWSKERGLCDLGFGREKTTYCYFACAASTSLPYNSDIRLIVTKAAIVITVADDFFDTKGSLDDLEKLTDAVHRWDVKGLDSHSKTIFEALVDLVADIRMKYLQQNGRDIEENLQHLWYETFKSWLVEAKWARVRSKPSVDEYLRNAMTSIAAHTLVLQASCFLGFPVDNQLWSTPRQEITSLLMVTTRLLNDTQSYLKEEDEGKINYVWLYMNEKQEDKMEDSIQHVQALVNMRRKEFLKHVLSTGDEEHCDQQLPKSCKQLHLSCLKVFNMFFNSSNLYDSDDQLLHDIDKAFVSPPKVDKFMVSPQYHPLPPLFLHPPHQVVKKRGTKITNYKNPSLVKNHPWRRGFTLQHPISRLGATIRVGDILAASKMKQCFN